MLEAYNQVRANKGSAGIDGITIDEIDDYLRKHWRSTKELIKQRKYKPQPVLRNPVRSSYRIVNDVRHK